MAAKPALIAAAVAGTLTLGTAGYFANEWRVCSGAREDFLATIDGYTANVQANALASSAGVRLDREETKRLQDLSLQIQKVQLENIYERCGDAAGREAASHASDALLKAMSDVSAAF